VVWLGLAGLALALPAWALDPDRGSDFTSGRNPMAVESLPTGGLLAIGSSLFLSALVASVVSLVLRIPRSQGAERQQIKWFAFAAAVAGVVLPLSLLFWDKGGVFRVLPAFALTGLPIAACIAILRYRLYDIDVVINRTLVYGGLTLLLAAAWAASALLLGTALGRGSAWSTAGATLVAAIAFSPLRERLQDAVDRRFNRARYEALRRIDGFLQELRAGRAAPEGVEQVLREVLCDNEIELRFFLPESELYVDSRGVPATDLPQDARSQILIERSGRPLAMVLHNPATQREPTLLSRVVEAGDLAIEIARLRVEVRRQLNEVRASRTRIVDATNEERRRIERDLHDGAQQRLVSIGLALRHAQHELACSSPAGAGRTLDGAVTEVELAIEELRELARGLPPAQLDHGLRPALRELASRAPFPVEVHAAPERFAVGAEAAAYFIACEGLTNAIKHAGASKVVLEAGRQSGNLVVSVADDGIGGAAPTDGSGLSGLADRVIAQGGTLRIDSRRGAGTRLTAELPCES
jgi:signal transduction histidine kinase